MSSPQNTAKRLPPALRWLLLISGLIAVALGVLGIFLPVLPTVPFLLLAVACFARSSDRFFNWLLEHAHLGPLVKPYLNGRGITSKTKIRAITLIWTSISFSIYMLDGRDWVRLTLILIAAGVSCYLLKLPVMETENP